MFNHKFIKYCLNKNHLFWCLFCLFVCFWFFYSTVTSPFEPSVNINYDTRKLVAYTEEEEEQQQQRQVRPQRKISHNHARVILCSFACSCSPISCNDSRPKGAFVFSAITRWNTTGSAISRDIFLTGCLDLSISSFVLFTAQVRVVPISHSRPKTLFSKLIEDLRLRSESFPYGVSRQLSKNFELLCTLNWWFDWLWEQLHSFSLLCCYVVLVFNATSRT